MNGISTKAICLSLNSRRFGRKRGRMTVLFFLLSDMPSLYDIPFLFEKMVFKVIVQNFYQMKIIVHKMRS